MNSVAALLTQASQLEDKELESLLERLRALKSMGSAGTEEVSSQASEMYKCLDEAVYKARAFKLVPLSVIRAQKGWRGFIQAAEEAESVIESLENDRVKKLAVRKWCCNLIVQRIIEQKLPIGRNSLTWGLLNLSSILDQYFPGYMASGLMPVVLKSLFQGTKRKFGV